jgi:hypothetical protein
MAKKLSMDTVFEVYEATGIVVETFEDAVTVLTEQRIALAQELKLLKQPLNKMKVVHKQGEEQQEEKPKKRLPLDKDPVYLANLRELILKKHNAQFDADGNFKKKK